MKKNSNAICVNGNKIYFNIRLKEYPGQGGIFRIKNYAIFPFITDDMVEMLYQYEYKGITFRDKP
jgi:hypothetical protein